MVTRTQQVQLVSPYLASTLKAEVFDLAGASQSTYTNAAFATIDAYNRRLLTYSVPSTTFQGSVVVKKSDDTAVIAVYDITGATNNDIYNAIAGATIGFAGAPYARTVRVTDGTSAISGASVVVTNGTSSITLSQTDGSGHSIAGLTADTWIIGVSKSGYASTSQTITLDGSSASTGFVDFALTAYAVVPSADPTKTTAYCVIRDGKGDPEVGKTIRLRLKTPPPASAEGNAFSVESFDSPASDSDGLMQVELMRLATYTAIYEGGYQVTFTTTDTGSYELPEGIFSRNIK